MPKKNASKKTTKKAQTAEVTTPTVEAPETVNDPVKGASVRMRDNGL